MATAKNSTAGLDLVNLSLKPSQIIDAICMAYHANEPIFLWGPPGTAKSQLFRAAQKRLSRELKDPDFGLIDFRAITRDVVDLNGIPSKSECGKYTDWLRPRFLPETGRGLFLMDEFNSAPGLMQAAGYGLVLDRIAGEHKLAPGWLPMAAGNYDTDGGVTTKQPTPLKSRFTHLNIQTVKHPTREGQYNLVNQREWCEEWLTWAVNHGVHPHVIAYHRKTQGTNLYAFDKNEQTYPCLRTWEKVSNLLNQGLGGGLLYPMIAGVIGKGYASEVVAYMRDALELPDIKLILEKPLTAPVPKDSGMKYAIVTMLGMAVQTQDEFASVLKYLGRTEIGPEFMVLGVQDIIMRVKPLRMCSEFITFAKGPHGVAVLELAKGLQD